MNKKILIINAGSSSIKFKIYDFVSQKELSFGKCERIFIDGSFQMVYYENDEPKRKPKEIEFESKEKFSNHRDAINYLLKILIELKIIDNLNEIVAIGHRIVHGGHFFQDSTIIYTEVEEKIEKLINLAPIHNKPQLEVIKILKEKFSEIKHIATFDTTFHNTIPEINYTYAIPESWRKDHFVRKYGAHGTSYRYITQETQKILKKDKVNIIVCHLGNGSSVCAIENNNSVNTSMGLTPLEGLVMGTRCGDIDPSIHNYIAKKLNITLEEINDILNNKSGFMGLCGFSDIRDILSKSTEGNMFNFVVSLFAKRVAEYIAKYINELGNNVHAIVFTGGIGENNPIIREMIIKYINIGKFKICHSSNKKKYEKYLKINKMFSTKMFCIKTDEEYMILKDVLKLI